MPPCLTLSIIRYGSRVKWSNPGKGVATSPTLQCSKLSKREPSGYPRLWSPTLLTYYAKTASLKPEVKVINFKGKRFNLFQILVRLCLQGIEYIHVSVLLRKLHTHMHRHAHTHTHRDNHTYRHIHVCTHATSLLNVCVLSTF